MKATGDGVFAGDYPINFALPLLIIQLLLILVLSRAIAAVLRPLRQPRVIAEIIGGILLGKSCMGRIPGFTDTIFPPKSLPTLTTVANLGLVYFLFIVGLELDMRTIAKVGAKAMGIAITGILVPFTVGVGTAFAVRALLGIDSPFGPFLVFLGVAMSITAFPVLARILAERKLLTTDVGQMAMSAAAVDDVVAWVLLALAVALTTATSSPIIILWILLCSVAFVVIMFAGVRPLMEMLVRRAMSTDPIPEWIVAVTLVGVLVASFTTELIGIHAIFGAFIFGLCIPKDGAFPTLILEKIEDFIAIVLIPLYFASSGLAVNFQSITPNGVAVMFIVIFAACLGKLGGIFVSSLVAGMTVRKALVMGILMNTKGLVELIVLNIGLAKGVINVEFYTIMVIMALVTTFMTSPLVMAIYAPARDKRPYDKTITDQGDKKELRLLECVYGTQNVPSIMNLTEIFRGTRKHPLRVFLMHLVELSERSSAIAMVTRVRKDGKPYWSKDAERKGRDQVVVAFRAYADLSRVSVVPLTSISKFDNMHEDICTTAEERYTSLIVMPYYKFLNGDDDWVVNHGFQEVTRKLLKTAPCSVAILVDRGLGGFTNMPPVGVERHIAVLFFGGPDDREALSLARRMQEHPGVSLTVIQIVSSEEASLSMQIEQQQQPNGGATARTPIAAVSFAVPVDNLVVESEAKQDEIALAPIIDGASTSVPEVPVSSMAPVPEATDEGEESIMVESTRQRTPRAKLAYEKRQVDDVLVALTAAAEEDFDLFVVGRGRRPSLALARLAAQRTPFRPYFRTPFSEPAGAEATGSDLGPVGDVLANSSSGSVLVVQQHDEAMVRSFSAV